MYIKSIIKIFERYGYYIVKSPSDRNVTVYSCYTSYHSTFLSYHAAYNYFVIHCLFKFK